MKKIFKIVVTLFIFLVIFINPFAVKASYQVIEE